MSRLLALYPRAWRARYGEEFADLVASRPPSLRDRLDIVAGAVDARLHPQVPDLEAPEGRSAGDPVSRGALILVGLLLTTWSVVSVQTAVRWDSGLEPSGPHLLMVTGFIAGILAAGLAPIAGALVAFRYGSSIGTAGAIGALLAGAGILTSALGMGIPALICLVAGPVLLSWQARGRIVSDLVALAFAGGAIVTTLGFVLFFASEGQSLERLWLILGLGPSWIALGAGLRRPADAPSRDASSSPSLAGA